MAAAMGGAALALAGCAATTAATLPVATTTAPHHRVLATPEVEQPGWSVLSESHGILLADRRSFIFADGAKVVVFRLRVGRVSFDLHTGSEDPPGVAAEVGPGAGPSISARERPLLLAAFNGGFKVASGSGGFVLDGRRFIGLTRGDATLVIDRDGAAHVGTWGSELPFKGERVWSARQNLSMLVNGGRPSPAVNDLAAWGVTLGGVPNPARSAVGIDARGNLLFAASEHCLPADLATALIRSGAVRAMEMDINPWWVQFDSAPHPGARLNAAVPDQVQPSTVYLTGWTRDFFVVLVRRTASA